MMRRCCWQRTSRCAWGEKHLHPLSALMHSTPKTHGRATVCAVGCAGDTSSTHEPFWCESSIPSIRIAAPPRPITVRRNGRGCWWAWHVQSRTHSCTHTHARTHIHNTCTCTITSHAYTYTRTHTHSCTHSLSPTHTTGLSHDINITSTFHSFNFLPSMRACVRARLECGRLRSPAAAREDLRSGPSTERAKRIDSVFLPSPSSSINSWRSRACVHACVCACVRALRARMNACHS